MDVIRRQVRVCPCVRLINELLISHWFKFVVAITSVDVSAPTEIFSSEPQAANLNSNTILHAVWCLCPLEGCL